MDSSNIEIKNRLLKRQINRHIKNNESLSAEHQALFQEIEETYAHYESDRALLERAMDLSSEELREQKEQIKKINDQLAAKNVQLQQSLDEVTKARTGKAATTIVLVVGLALFIISETIDYELDILSQFPILIIILMKFLIACLLKPVESGLESFMLKRAHKNSHMQPSVT